MRDLKYYNKFENDEEGNPIELPQSEEQEYPVVSCIATEDLGEGSYEYEVRYAKKKDYSDLPFGIYAHSSTEIKLTWDQGVFGLNQINVVGSNTYASTTIYRKIDNSDTWIETVPTLGRTVAPNGVILKPENYYTIIYLPKGSTLWLLSTGLCKYKTSTSGSGGMIPGGPGGSTTTTTTYGNVMLESTGSISILGNILSLVMGQNFSGRHSIDSYTGTESAFREVFSWFGDKLLSARHLILPNASADKQFLGTFSGCNMLSEPPVLPYSGSLSVSEYARMFENCSSLSYLSTNFTIDPLSGSGRNPCFDMMKGVGNSGIFRKNPNLDSEYASSIVPEGWTVINNAIINNG